VARRLRGLGVSAGEAAAPVARLGAVPVLPADPAPVADAEAESARAADALGAVADELERRAARVEGTAREVLESQAIIARDPALADGVRTRVQSGLDAPHAVAEAYGEHRALLESLGGYMAERVADLDDLRDRAIAVLLGSPTPGVPERDEPFVLVAVDLAPADTATLDPAKVAAIVTEQGGPTGHTAILAKQLGIPAVAACADAAELTDGMRARGHGPGSTADGRAIPLLVNLGGPGDIDAAALKGEGVGLLRTEFLFMDRATSSTAAEQETAYARVFAAFAGRRVVVRTLDVGADKPLASLSRPPEPNPALGVRGLRLGHAHPELLEEQLAAIAVAGRGGDAEVWVMAPMVATVAEARDFVEQARGHGLEHVGVMVEVPSAAICAREILEVADFASIGTNDLAQCTIAADRLAGPLTGLLDPWQPALLRLIETVGSAGAAVGRSVGVCGEAASDPLLALVLVGLGVTSLSMAPGCLPDVRAALAERTHTDCRELAAAALSAASAADARAAAMRSLHGGTPAIRPRVGGATSG
jgi:phosphoenolpyruvate-protein phosphotransferase (PTS system enzyme I)